MPGRTSRKSSISAGLRPGSRSLSAALRSGADTTAFRAARPSSVGAAVAGAGGGADLQAAAQTRRRAMRFMTTSLDEVVVGRPAAAGEQQTVGPGGADELVDDLRRDDEVAARSNLVLLPVERQRSLAGEEHRVLGGGVPVCRKPGAGGRLCVNGRALRVRIDPG